MFRLRYLDIVSVHEDVLARIVDKLVGDVHIENISFTCDVGDDEGQDLPFATLRRPSEGIEPGIEKSVSVQVPDIEKH